MPPASGIGVGIDHTMRGAIIVVDGRVGAADAIALLARPLARPLPTPQPPRGGAPNLIGGLRGLVFPRTLDAAQLEQPSGSAEDRLPTQRPSKGPRPYFRFSEEERVLGLSFKIQPPPQPTEPASPGT